MVKSMPIEEFFGWIEFLAWRNEKEREAYKSASSGRTRSR